MEQLIRGWWFGFSTRAVRASSDLFAVADGPETTDQAPSPPAGFAVVTGDAGNPRPREQDQRTDRQLAW